MCCSEVDQADNAVFATFQSLRQPSSEWRKVLIVMNVTSIVKDMMKRRRNVQSIGSDIVCFQPSAEKPLHIPRKSSRFAHSCDQANPAENMDDSNSIGVALETLSRQVDDAQNSPVYTDRRNELLASERALRWDEPAKLRASSTELEAAHILFKIREHERVNPENFGNVPGEAVPDLETTRDMGDRFLVNKPRILQSKVFHIATQMPKGAHLHLHFNSELPPEMLLPHARRPEVRETMFVRSTRPLLTPDDFDQTEIVFSVLPKETKQGDIFSPHYDPEWKVPSSCAWMKWADFRQRFPDNVDCIKQPDVIPQLEGKAEYWAREKMVITVDHAYHDRQTTNGAWACFNQGTRAFKGLLNYETIYRWYIGEMIDSMIEDKVMYAEVRPMLLDKWIPSDDGNTKLYHYDQMRITCEEIRRKQDYLEGRKELHKFPFGLRVIYCTPRSIPRARMEVELQDCLKLKYQYPDLICGFDLVGAEDRPNHIGYYADLLYGFTQTCEKLNLKIPFMFHAGETLLDTGGSQNPDNSNLYDSLLLNAKRIGHGYSLLKHPLLVQKYKEQDICLELCPISNELLHLCANAKEHIFPELLAAGLHCTLNADNPSLFRGIGYASSSLSSEFYQVMVGDTRMNLHGWKQLAEWSLEHSCLTDEQHLESERIFARDWESYCQWIVTTYGEFASTLPDPSE